MHERGVHVKTFGWQKFPVFLELSSLRRRGATYLADLSAPSIAPNRGTP